MEAGQGSPCMGSNSHQLTVQPRHLAIGDTRNPRHERSAKASPVMAAILGVRIWSALRLLSSRNSSTRPFAKLACSMACGDHPEHPLLSQPGLLMPCAPGGGAPSQLGPLQQRCGTLLHAQTGRPHPHTHARGPTAPQSVSSCMSRMVLCLPAGVVCTSSVSLELQR